jgi:hypothetical protein
MIKDKRYYRKKALLLTLLYSLAIFTLGTCTYVSLAWFSASRRTHANFESISLATGFSVKIKYLSYNAQYENGVKYYHGYKRADIGTLDSSFTYSQDFLSFEGDTSSGPLGNKYFAPLYASTYCFEITYDGGEASFTAALTSFSSPASALEYSDTLSSYISLSEAIDVFTGYSDGTNLDADAKSFLEATTGDAATDRFNHTGASLAEGEEDSWNPSMSMTIPSGGTAYLFITEYFSNDSSTFYSPVEGNSDHWIHDSKGSSDPYKGLTIVLTGVAINRG